ncbi:6075_t:CDS:2, partial [Acaulospora colombiana]
GRDITFASNICVDTQEISTPRDYKHSKCESGLKYGRSRILAEKESLLWKKYMLDNSTAINVFNLLLGSVYYPIRRSLHLKTRGGTSLARLRNGGPTPLDTHFSTATSASHSQPSLLRAHPPPSPP